MEKIRNYALGRYDVYFFSKKDFYFAFVPALISFFIYLSAMHPSLAAGDSGELSAAVKHLGIPHAPGYSLLVILAKPFSYIPYGALSWRLNLFSVFCASLTIFFTFLLILKLLMSTKTKKERALFASFFASMSFALSKTFWTQAELFEVYTLASIFYPLFFLVLLHWMDYMILHHKDRELYFGDRLVMLYSFLFGLGIVAHLTTLMTEILGAWVILSMLMLFPFSSPHREKGGRGGVYVVAFLVFITFGYSKFYMEIVRLDASIFDQEKLKNGLTWFLFTQAALFFFYVYDRFLSKSRYEANNFFKRFYYLGAKSFATFYLGYFAHAYVFFRSYANPPINWGGLSDENGFFLRLAKFLNFLWRKQYGSQGKLPLTWDNFLDQLKINVFFHNGAQYTPFFYVLMLLGVYQVFKKNAYLGLTLLIALLSFNLQLIFYLRMDIDSRFVEVSDVFFIFSYFCLSLFIGFGLSLLLEWMQKAALKLHKRSHRL